MIRLTKTQLRPAIETLTLAMLEDPQTEWFFPDPVGRERRLRYAMEFTVKYGLAYGEAWATSENCEGVAIWLPSHRAERTLPRIIRCGGLVSTAKLGWSVLRQYLRIGKYLDEVEQRCAPFPHWYLDILGVTPRCQRRGFGSVLLREMFARVDRERRPVYLYTSKETNMQMYLRYRFTVASVGHFPGTNVPHWSMVRQPQS
jgi:GNAT superfamily N-acetyltransferase